MKFQQKIDELRNIYRKTLSPLVTNDYVLLDVPYHRNIGDVLIWEGERNFLSTLPYKNLGTHSFVSWQRKQLHPKAIILLHGGGNFGDLYRCYQDFRLRVISDYPNNKIIILPQSVWYEDKSLIKKDAEIMSCHKNLTLCARDKWSYEFMQRHFPANNILLIPDSAFCISDSFLDCYRHKEVPGKELYFERTDKELGATLPKGLAINMEVHDWPTYEQPYNVFNRFWWVAHVQGALRRLNILKPILSPTLDSYADWHIRCRSVELGCKFLSPYDHIITTRLHTLILSVLLHKPVDYINNTTSKLSAYADTWLSDLDEVKPLKLPKSFICDETK